MIETEKYCVRCDKTKIHLDNDLWCRDCLKEIIGEREDRLKRVPMLPEKVPIKYVKGKVCLWCQKLKKFDQFYKNKTNKDGLTIYCKYCVKRRKKGMPKVIVNRYCKNCSKLLTGLKKKFCNLECNINYNKKNRKPRPPKVIVKKYCIKCSKLLVRYQTKYCSRKCYTKNKKNYKIKPEPKVSRQTMICKRCGEPYTNFYEQKEFPIGDKRNYCKECRELYNKAVYFKPPPQYVETKTKLCPKCGMRIKKIWEFCFSCNKLEKANIIEKENRDWSRT